jgi:putative Mg2+ transporter-C (MgtC) family protein
MISETDILLRLLVAFILGAIIGFERESDNQPAGLRTNIILVVGSALAMILSVTLAHVYPPIQGAAGDPARLAAQVISGIGFLGAGAILHAGVSIKGLTTAATIWTMAIVGLAVGAGFIIEATTVTITLFIVLTILEKFEHRFFHPKWIVPITLWIKDEPVDLEALRQVFKLKYLRLLSLSREHDLVSNETTIHLEFSCKREKLLDEVQAKILKVPGLQKVHFGKSVII